MANSLVEVTEVMFDNFIQGFDASCVVSRAASMFSPDQQTMQRAGDVIYRPQDYQMDIVTGLDVSAAAKTDIIQRNVPAVYKDIQNVVWELNAEEMRDPETMKRSGVAAGKRLSAKIDSLVAAEVVAKAGIVIKSTSSFDWDDAAQADALLSSRGAPVGVDRTLILQPFHAKSALSELGGRGTYNGGVADAYEKAMLPNLVSSFTTLRADVIPTQTVTGTVSGTTVNGANQKLTVAAMSGGLIQDNRQMTLVVQGANVANIKAGDKFTCGINAVHNLTKDDTGELMTFTVLSTSGGGTNLVISPAIVTSGPYQNVTGSPANNAPVTFLNTATKSPSLFWVDGAVELMTGRLAFPTGQGAQVMTATSKNGVPIVMAWEFNALTGKVVARYSVLCGPNVLNPEMAGVILCNQV